MIFKLGPALQEIEFPARRLREAAAPPSAGKMVAAAKIPLRDLTERAILQQAAPVGALVTPQAAFCTSTGVPGCTWNRLRESPEAPIF